jgi:hypothetical protein
MKLPVFTAEDTVYRTSAQYRLAGGRPDSMPWILPQDGSCFGFSGPCIEHRRFVVRADCSTGSVPCDCTPSCGPCQPGGTRTCVDNNCNDWVDQCTCTESCGPCLPGGQRWCVDRLCQRSLQPCTCTPSCGLCTPVPGSGGTSFSRRCVDQFCNTSVSTCTPTPCTSSSQCPPGLSCGCCPVTTLFFSCWPWPFSFICSPAGSATTSTCCC